MSNTLLPNETSPLLSLESAIIGYKSAIFPPISTHLNHSQLVAVMGANGTGKSTLLKSIAGYIPLIDGKIIATPGATITYIPSQTPRVKHLSLIDMMVAGLYRDSNWIGAINRAQMEDVERVLKSVGLFNHRDRDISTLSDGEFHRATLARGVIQKSKILVMDEPTAFLDIANKIEMLQLLRKISCQERRSILFSTHDIQHALKIADRVWILGYRGFIEGRPENLIEKGAFNQMFESTSLKFDPTLLTFL
ncbi:MAG: ABC transporter ATP-binding protein [Bacteroidales bacterium]